VDLGFALTGSSPFLGGSWFCPNGLISFFRWILVSPKRAYLVRRWDRPHMGTLMIPIQVVSRGPTFVTETGDGILGGVHLGY
jgi:hypothetical protein